MALRGQGRPGETELNRAIIDRWVTVEPLPDGTPPLRNAASLHPGEIDVIRLALSKNIPYVLIDERHVRLIATSLGLKVVGTIGILVEAKRRGWIASLAGELHRLRAQASFRISEKLYQHALHLVGET